MASPQQGDLRLSGPPTGQGVGGRARTRDRRALADLWADLLPTMPPKPQEMRIIGVNVRKTLQDVNVLVSLIVSKTPTLSDCRFVKISKVCAQTN
ncbi:hypothetical protein PoB_004479100 [Plakobranchus ocellatus]|uniref:Uncharacterized protein n=1 Tax=Plakobranchus ocellatus TaxID=259542 RepID=A0AAV4BHE7_9GAST|nr:hypothetical protein PoB_004479100 [Plakobranchus ocellatus]